MPIPQTAQACSINRVVAILTLRKIALIQDGVFALFQVLVGRPLSLGRLAPLNAERLDNTVIQA
jgi:hypothetical protein